MSEESKAISRRPMVLALQGSPRKKGNTDRLLDVMLDAAAKRGVEVGRVRIQDLKITPCLEINACMKTGRCPIKDDMIGLYEKLEQARVVVVSSPIFFYGPSAQLKMVIDRCQAYWARKYRLNTPLGKGGYGVVVSAGATKGEKLFDGLLMTVKYFFDVLDLESAGELLVRGVDDAGEVDGRPDVLAEARALGERIADIVSGG